MTNYGRVTEHSIARVCRREVRAATEPFRVRLWLQYVTPDIGELAQYALDATK